MNLLCPACDQRISRWQVLRFLRLLSISCPRCGLLLTIDGSGRSALLGSILASILVAVLLGGLTDSTSVAGVTVIAGVFVGCRVCAGAGRLVESPENMNRRND